MGHEVDLPPVLGGRYRPLRPLGVGGMGAVYVVEHVHTGERLALKVLHTRARASNDAIERFKREARAMALVRSDHVVRVTDADVAPELDNAPFLVMELLEGTDLERATRGTPQSPRRVVEWLRQVCRGLERAHALDITHRDLKPENLFLTKHEDGSDLIKILDFGIAKVRADGAGSRTQTGQIVGTPKFMSPEQARGETDAVGPAADMWAVGLIAFRLLTGADYWTATAVTLLLAQIIYEPLVAPSARGCTIGSAFDAWFLRSCDRDPTKRWSSVREQVEALAEVLGDSTHTLPPAAPAVTADEPPVPAQRTPTLEATPTPPAVPTINSASVSRSADRPAGRPRRLAAVFGVGAAATALVAAGIVIGAKASGPVGATSLPLADNVLVVPPSNSTSATPSGEGAAAAPAVEPIDPPTASAAPPSPPRVAPAPRPPAPAVATSGPGGKRPPPKPSTGSTPPPPATPTAPSPPRDPLADQYLLKRGAPGRRGSWPARGPPRAPRRVPAGRSPGRRRPGGTRRIKSSSARQASCPDFRRAELDAPQQPRPQRHRRERQRDAHREQQVGQARVEAVLGRQQGAGDHGRHGGFDERHAHGEAAQVQQADVERGQQRGGEGEFEAEPEGESPALGAEGARVEAELRPDRNERDRHQGRGQAFEGGAHEGRIVAPGERGGDGEGPGGGEGGEASEGGAGGQPPRAGREGGGGGDAERRDEQERPRLVDEHADAQRLGPVERLEQREADERGVAEAGGEHERAGGLAPPAGAATDGDEEAERGEKLQPRHGDGGDRRGARGRGAERVVGAEQRERRQGEVGDVRVERGGRVGRQPPRPAQEGAGAEAGEDEQQLAHGARAAPLRLAGGPAQPGSARRPAK
jgi:serine/threonine-protein kinase